MAKDSRDNATDDMYDDGITPAMVGSLAPKSRNPAPKVRAGKADSYEQAAGRFRRFTGHTPEVAGKITLPQPKTAIVIGTVDAIEYTAVRDGKPVMLRHVFHERDKSAMLVSDDGRTVWILGARWKFTGRGFVDNGDRKRRR